VRIEEQIKRLQRIKAKIDLFKRLVANVQDELAAVGESAEHKALEAEHPGLLTEFCAEIREFSTRRIEQLGSGEEGANPTPPKRVVAPVREEAPPPPAPQPQANAEEEPRDPLKFLLKYRHLEGKRVSFSSKDGPVQGTVRGMVTPHITVETDTGFVLTVPPKELKVI
jgi:hypothetical protein